MSDVESKVEQHYSRGDLTDRILDALAEAGIDTDNLTHEDLVALDQMHVRGHQATKDLAATAGLTSQMHLLDVGCGLGGSARYLAVKPGCRVTAIDLTEDFCVTAAALNALVGLGDRVTVRQASALDLPFEDAAFDAVWSQHVQMNIPDKPRLYAEIARVLKPGGCFAAYDILAGPAGPPHYPCPWARTLDYSFLIEPGDWRVLLEAEGLEVMYWRDTSQLGLAWFAEMAERAKSGPPLPDRSKVVGADIKERLLNLRRSLSEELVVLVEAVCRKG